MVGEKDSKSEVEGRKEDQGMKMEGKEERIKEGLKFLTLGGKKKKITEYIDFFYSLHHLYKYIESQKRNKTNLREKKTAQYGNPQQQ